MIYSITHNRSSDIGCTIVHGGESSVVWAAMMVDSVPQQAGRTTFKTVNTKIEASRSALHEYQIPTALFLIIFIRREITALCALLCQLRTK